MVLVVSALKDTEDYYVRKVIMFSSPYKVIMFSSPYNSQIYIHLSLSCILLILYYGIDFVNLSIAKQKPYELLYGTILPEDFFYSF